MYSSPPAPSAVAQRRKLGVAVALLAVLALTAAALINVGESDAATQQSPPGDGGASPVTLASLAIADMPVTAVAVGTVVPLNTVQVRARVDGELRSVAFQEGQEVAEGQLLAAIDDRTARAALEQAQAQLARELAVLATATRDLRRYEQLVEAGFYSPQAESAQVSAVKQSQAAVLADEAVVDAARTQVAYTRIHAPLAGRLGARQVDIGNIVRSTDSTPLVTITQLQPISVSFNLPQALLAAIQAALIADRRSNGEQGGRVKVYSDSTAQEPIATGRLTLLNNLVDSGTGTVQVKARFENVERRLWPGQSVRVVVELETLKAASTLPEATVQRGPDGSFVFLADQAGTVSTLPVTVLATYGGRVAVSTAKPMDVGTKVVVEGQYRLKDGARYRVASAGGTPSASAPAQ